MGILLEYFRGMFSILEKYCSHINKLYTINTDEEFNSCSCEDGKLCALGSQCKVTALVFCYIFGNPEHNLYQQAKKNRNENQKTIESMKNKIKSMPNNSYLHFMVAVHSITEFVGHRFIIFIVKENNNLNIFKIQSYVNSYNARVDQLTEQKCYQQMSTFIKIFEKKNVNENFTKEEDNDFWKLFTFENLKANIEIPNYIHVFDYFQSESDLNLPKNFRRLKERINGNIEKITNNPREIINEYLKSSRVLSDTLGIQYTKNQKLNQIIDTISQISNAFEIQSNKHVIGSDKNRQVDIAQQFKKLY